MKENIQIYESEMIESSGLADDGYNEIDFINFPPGSVVVLRCVFFLFFFFVLIVKIMYSYSVCLRS